MKSKNIFDLDPERLASTDEHGHRVYIHPEDVKGIWKDRRSFVYFILIIIYLVIPWIYIDGKPSLLIDIFKREFTILGFTLHGVEPIFFFLLVASGLFAIGLVTALFGRVWCGWACPQTVFIQGIFMKIDTFFEGHARARRELDHAPWSFKKLLRRSGKWLTFTVISLHIAHTFIGYFVGPRELFEMTMQGPGDNWGVFMATMIITTILLLDFGWFREQFCIIACPYGRMQSVMMDDNSLVISYDIKRGEPRRGTDGVIRAQEGDCINCYNCVKVCPTGIDIRRGTQLECIACTQCIDACDDIMTKLKRPKGLIRYSSENELQGKKRKVFTLRSGIYAFISISFLGLIAYFLTASTNLNMVFIRSKIPFQVIESGQTIVNHFTLKLGHQGEKIYEVDFRIKQTEFSSFIKLITVQHPTIVDVPDKKIVIFFKFPPSILLGGSRKVTIEALDRDSGIIFATKEVTLVGPNH